MFDDIINEDAVAKLVALKKKGVASAVEAVEIINKMKGKNE